MLYDLDKKKRRESFNEGFWDDFTNRDVFEDFPFGRSKGMPAVNVLENESEFILEIASPGLCKDDYTLNVENDVLSISGKKEIADKDRTYNRREFHPATFQRSFLLPDYVDKDKIAASCADGILTIHIPKMEVRVKSKRINIQ